MSDFNFRLFDFPVTVQPVFWFTAAILSAMICGPITEMPIWICEMAVIVGVIFLSILVHELGHGFAYRQLFRTESSITLQAFGGFTAPAHGHPRRRGLIGTTQESFLAFAGPLAGFILAAVTYFFYSFFTPPTNHPPLLYHLIALFFSMTCFISVFWGIFNLLPIFPMDGGFILREVFGYLFPRRGERYTYLFSLTLSVMLAVISLRFGEVYMTALFAMFAYQNYQRLAFMTFR